LQEKEHINLTPYEKNLEIWRQLWRVIERSDIIVQILDARNPLLFRCSDLETYVKEVDEKKINVLLLNKADFLTEQERKCWCKYFEEAGIRIAFFSALQQIKKASKDNSIKQTASDDSSTEKAIPSILTKEGISGISSTSVEKDISSTSAEEDISSMSTEENTFSASTEENVSHTLTEEAISSNKIENSPNILCQDGLISFFKSIGKSIEKSNPVLNVGFVGYPNVGKSSTINAILMSKKVSVSRTPGKTKHFQTLFVDKDLCLCDCPGLVFPNFVSTKAEMVVNGILPVDELSHWVEPISLVTNLIPRNILESTYSVMLPSPAEGKDINSQPTAEEFLDAYGYNRGYMTQRGLPNNALSARHILKDFIDGKILYCYAPPGIKQEDYHKFPDVRPVKSVQNTAKERNYFSEEEKMFFSKQSEVHIKGKKHEMQLDSKGRPSKYHNNKNKHQKLKKKHKEPMY
ncbi:large subunit GTPase 1 homolog, partial [Stegodyphus dumicola]|uniref:large subunit GTPase 1 homolog n=1 Tax=Stegodyphus dumicola TaxID=202533 RepID=UPI0015AF95FA